MNSQINHQTIDESIVNRARNDLVFTSQGSAILVICTVVVSFAYFMQPYVPRAPLAVWSVLCLCTYALRYFICTAYSRSSDEYKARTHWQQLFSFASAFSGFTWGLAVYIIFPEESKNHQMLMIILLVILSAATTVTHSAYKWASLSFTVSCLVPASIFLFYQNEEGFAELGIYICLFMLMMVSAAAYLSKTTNRIFTLSYENNKLILSLRKSNGELTQKNAQLEVTREELRHANDDLQKLATTDALTSLTNRRKFEALIKVKWRRSSDDGTPLSLIFINIDMFKQFNDFYGQRKGDSCLVQIADFLSHEPEINRSGDCVARYSGDEFAILLFDADANYAKRVAEKLRNGVELLRISRAEMPQELSPWVSVSIGAATETEFDEISYEELIENADKSLHNAKRSGRNQIWHHNDLH